MELPSPLIEKFLPANIVRGFSDSVIKKENARIHILCFHGALCYYYDHRLYSSQDSKHAEIKLQLGRFFVNGFGRFEKLHVITQLSNRVEVQAMSVDAYGLLMGIGGECCSKALFPFSVHKPKDPAFIVSVASSFARVFNRLYPLWIQSRQSSQRLLTTGVIMREILVAHSESRHEACGPHARLALEAWCLEIFDSEYSQLSDAQKTNPDHATTRAMFWCASFFYNMLNPRWDRDGGEVFDWIDARLDAYVLETDTGYRPEFFRAVWDARQRVLEKQEGLRRLRRALGGMSQRLGRELIRTIDEIRALNVDNFYLSSDEESQIQTIMGRVLSESLFLFEQNMVLHAMSAAGMYTDPRASSSDRPMRSIMAEVDSVPGVSSDTVDSLVGQGDNIQWRNEGERNDEEDEDDGMMAERGSSRRSRNQRRRDARERQIAEVTVSMKALHDKVVEQIAALNARAVVDAAKDREDWLEDKYPLMIRAANERIRKAVEAHCKRAAVEAAVEQLRRKEESARAAAEEQWRRQEELARATAEAQWRRQEELARAAAEEQRRRAEESAAQRTEAAVREQALVQLEALRMDMAGRARDLVLHILGEKECFICYAPIDLLDPAVSFLACCDGGSFACPQCIARHRNHAIQAVPIAARLMDRMLTRPSALQ